MAKRVIELLVSDLSGKDIKDGEGETVKFSIGPTSYEMDLTEAEAGQFYAAVTKYTDVATRTGGRGARAGDVVDALPHQLGDVQAAVHQRQHLVEIAAATVHEQVVRAARIAGGAQPELARRVRAQHVT